MAGDHNVYANTTRYNYGPAWFYILRVLDMVPGFGADPTWSLRWKVAVLLSAVDLCLLFLLARRFGIEAGILFWLNPIAIIITGFHGQFDNLAVLLALVAAQMIGPASPPSIRRQIGGLLILGGSLIVKHVFFFFPVWLAFQQPSRLRKSLCLIIPTTIFIASFVPYVGGGGGAGIVNNVFLYRSLSNSPFWLGVAPRVVVDKVPILIFFLGSLTICGLLWRKLDSLNSALRYSVALVVFSSALANQYLAIPLAAIAVRPNVLYLLYTLVGTVFLIASSDGFHWPIGISPSGFEELISLLFLGLLLETVPRDRVGQFVARIIGFARWIEHEVVTQVGGEPDTKP
jgi:hypothetical protein